MSSILFSENEISCYGIYKCMYTFFNNYYIAPALDFVSIATKK